MGIVRDNLFEANLNLPQDYIDKVKREASETIGTNGPSHQDMMQMGQLLQRIFPIQRGHEDELTELGKSVIKKFYGPVIDGVELDVKIVLPDDEEKREMAEKMLQDDDQEEEQEQPQFDSPEIEMELEGIEDDIDKRKLINNIMQGEAQNVHSMMYDMRDQVTEITGSDELLDLYMQFLELNRKFDWDDRANLEEMMAQNPDMANAMETEWEDGGEDEEGNPLGDKPKIKARVLDLPMLIHEIVKGIYELIAAGAIDPDPVRAEKVLKATDTLADEKEDIKFGPFIARDLRNYVNKVAETISGAMDIPNLREFVFGEMVTMPSKQFVELVTGILMQEDWPQKTISEMIQKIQGEFDKYQQSEVQAQLPGAFSDTDDEDESPEGVEDFDDVDDEENDLINFMRGSQEEPKEDKKPTWNTMTKGALNNAMNKAIDEEDWETAQEIQKELDRRPK